MKRPAIMVLFGLGPMALLAIAIGTLLSARIPHGFEVVLWPMIVPGALLASAVAWVRKSDTSPRVKTAFVATYSIILAAVGYFSLHTTTAIWAAI